MRICGLFGYGIAVDGDAESQLPWMAEEYEEEYYNDFLEWASQVTGYREPGVAYNELFQELTVEGERERFEKQLPIVEFKASDSLFVLLTGYYWVSENTILPVNLSLDAEAFEQAKGRAIEFCNKHGIDFSRADWILTGFVA